MSRDHYPAVSWSITSANVGFIAVKPMVACNAGGRLARPRTGFQESQAFSEPVTGVGYPGYILASCPAIFGSCNNFADLTAPQPLHRRFSTTGEGYALIIGSQLNNPIFSSYTGVVPGNSDVIGYVFPNVDSDGDTLIDGMERMLGLNPALQHSDGDGIPDGGDHLLGGVEYPMLSIP